MTHRAQDAERRMIAHGARPLVPYRGSRTPWPCQCMTCGERIEPRFDNVVNGKQGPCKWCGGRARVPEDQAVAEMIAVGASPRVPYPAVDKPWECECLTCGSIITPELMTVRAGSRPCKWCAGSEISPEAARDYMISLGEVTPKVSYPGVDKPWPSECRNCDREVTPSLHSVKNRGSKGCIYCAGNAPMDPAYAESLLRRAGAEPLEPFPGRNRRWKARCLDPACGAVVYPILRSIQRNSSPACPECSGPGFNPLAPSYLYLVINHTLSAAKAGIMNAGSSRLDQHRRAGWHTHDTVYAPTGWLARAAERAVIARWRELGWPQAITDPAAMPQGGMSETVAHAPGRDQHVLWTHVLTAVDRITRTRTAP